MGLSLLIPLYWGKGWEAVALAQVLLVFGGICALVYWVGYCYRAASVVRSAIKTSSVACLSLAGWFAGGDWTLIAALGFCALGDFALSRDSARLFLLGVGAFAVGHLCYIATFLTHPSGEIGRLGSHPRLTALIVLGLVGLGMAVLLYRTAGLLRFAVVAYVPVIVAMGCAALVLPASGGLVLALLGAFLFIVSDFVLSLELFVLPAGSPQRRLTPFAVWGTYWGAQALLLTGLVAA